MKKENQHLIRYSMQLAMLHQLLYKKLITKEEYFSALEQENSNKNMLTSMAAQADIYEKLIETEKNQLVIMQAIADLYEKENGGV